MARVALAFAYDGAAFESFARQPGRRTVEGELLQVLARENMVENPRRAGFEAASRTDKGVSAWQNVCAFDTEADVRSIAHIRGLPPGLFLLSACAVPGAFSPRRQATRRTYRYSLGRRTLDWDRVREAASLVEGLHDFRNFCRREDGVTTRRRIERVQLLGRGDERVLRFVAPNFLWEQVRRLVTALVKVGQGEWRPPRVKALLGSARHEPVAPAEPSPLVLEGVEMPVAFPRPSKALAERIASEARRARLRDRYFAGLAERVPTDRR